MCDREQEHVTRLVPIGSASDRVIEVANSPEIPVLLLMNTGIFGLHISVESLVFLKNLHASETDITMKKITLSGHIVVPDCDVANVRQALPVHIAATRAEKGCIVFNVEEHATEAGRFEVYEEFETPAAFKLHQKRVRESNWGSVTKNVTRHYVIDGLDEDHS